MQTLHEDLFLEYRPDTLQAVRKLYDMDKAGSMDEAINIIEEWIKKQKHFTNKEFGKEYLERLIIASKGSVERTKNRLDKICTSRNLVPEFIATINVKEFKPIPAFVDLFLPKLTPDHDRVYMLKFVGKELNKCSLLDLYKRGILEAFGVRFKALHLLTPSRVVDTLVTFLKLLTGQKMGDRFIVNSTLETLYEFMPKEVLPYKYGGEAKPYLKLQEDFHEALSSKEFIEYMMKTKDYKTDESLRSVDKFKEQYMGIPGTFRNINLD
ncbi:uncharacterized protein LOC131844026 [Achroia grisella]|uniref:uncharacterized protein LOC131844026 n=1 Tax=Achroia grisella TaxID=688607 RepID=UPI0027D24F19|nr:uncharacterized protein LOC131844026 [Achroia grisella]